MGIRFKADGRLEIKMQKWLIYVYCNRLPGTYYIVPTMRYDRSNSYQEGGLWLFFLSAFLLIDIFKIKD